jgi:hypothetical protein
VLLPMAVGIFCAAAETRHGLADGARRRALGLPAGHVVFLFHSFQSARVALAIVSAD